MSDGVTSVFFGEVESLVGVVDEGLFRFAVLRPCGDTNGHGTGEFTEM